MNRKSTESDIVNIEQQIRDCEEHIARLEHMKNSNSEADRVSWMKMNKINEDLDESYRQMAVLKIRQMMGY